MSYATEVCPQAAWLVILFVQYPSAGKRLMMSSVWLVIHLYGHLKTKTAVCCPFQKSGKYFRILSTSKLHVSRAHKNWNAIFVDTVFTAGNCSEEELMRLLVIITCLFQSKISWWMSSLNLIILTVLKLRMHQILQNKIHINWHRLC